MQFWPQQTYVVVSHNHRSVEHAPAIPWPARALKSSAGAPGRLVGNCPFAEGVDMCDTPGQPLSGGRLRRIFRRERTTPISIPRADEGHRADELICILSRCIYGDVEVIGVHDGPGGLRSIAGPRPRDEHELWREKLVRVRLVREPDEPDDPDAISVLTEGGVLLGRVARSSARRMAPVIDAVLREIATKREYRGCTVDVCCTAFVSAEWDDLDDIDDVEDIHAPALLEVTLLVDDGGLSWKISGRGIAVPC
jgi:hypothetical protein